MLDIDLIVSIVTYNNEAIIEETIRSIIEYTKGISYKIVIHDNNSTDKTIDIIQSIGSSEIDIIDSRTNYGFGYGHNQIIQKYEAKYYLIYNPDLRLKNNILKEMFDFMEKNQSIGMASPKILHPSGEIQYLCKQHPTVFDLFVRRFIPTSLKKLAKSRENWYEMRNTGYNKQFIIPYTTGCFMFFRSEVLHQVRGFDEKIFLHLEDADISRRVNQISQCVFYPYNYVEHLWARGSHKSIQQTFITIKSAWYYFNKWGWKFY